MKLIKILLVTLLITCSFTLKAKKNLASNKLTTDESNKKETEKSDKALVKERSNIEAKVKTENKTETKNEAKTETKTEIKTETKTENKEKSENKAEAKSANTAENKEKAKESNSVETKETEKNTDVTRVKEKSLNRQEAVDAVEVERDSNNEKKVYTTFDKETEALEKQPGEELQTNSDHATPISSVTPISPLRDVPNHEINVAELPSSNAITGLDVYGPPPKDHKMELLPVSYVKELSPAGKAALELQESGDIEYQKLINAGFESPKTISQIIGDTPTRVDKAALTDYRWKPTDPRNNDSFWQNVEYNKYNNRLLDTHRYYTPAKFEKNMFGNIIVHAPSNSNMEITTPARNVLSTQSMSGFLSVDESENFISEDEIDALDTSNFDKPDVLN